MKTINVVVDRTPVAIDRAVFAALLDNSVARTYKAYATAVERGSISLSDLAFLARKGDIPLALFFAPLPVAESQVAAKTQKLLAGTGKETFSVNSRSQVELRDIELIVKDLIRKQQLLKRLDPSLRPNEIVGMLSRPSRSPEADASRLMSSLGVTQEEIRATRNKEAALNLLISRVEANQILVSRSVQHYMPQRLTHARFSGVTIKDAKVPYIFLAGGDHGDYQEPTGRTIFTLALLTVLVARGIFAPVAFDGHNLSSHANREFQIVGAMLVPADVLGAVDLSSLDEVKAVADDIKVTPSAATVRAVQLRLINMATAESHLNALRREYEGRSKPGPRNAPSPENAVRKYNGTEFAKRMLHVLDTGGIGPREFCRSVCLNHLKPAQIDDLRRAVG